MEQELFNRKQVANILGIQPRTLWHWEKKGIIKPVGYVRRSPRYSLESIEEIPTERFPSKAFTEVKNVDN